MNKGIEVGTKLRCLNPEGWTKMVGLDLVDASGPAFDEIVTVRRIGIEVELDEVMAVAWFEGYLGENYDDAYDITGFEFGLVE